MPRNKKEYDRAYYALNKERRAKQIRDRNREQAQRNQVLFTEWMQSQACVDCGMNDWRILQLDHQGDKKYNVSEMFRSAYSWVKIEAEIAKCQVVCPNCHAIRTGTQYGFWRFATPL